MGFSLLRYQVVLVYLVGFIAVWYGALQHFHLIPGDMSLLLKATLLFAPVPLLVGSYALTLLVIGVSTFEDHPEAAIELDKQVKEVRLELEKRGIRI
jgi:hypothetical protein